MPELPEVENMALGLREAILKRPINAVEVKQPDILAGPKRRQWRAFMKSLPGGQIISITRRAKRLIAKIDNDCCLLFQLGMTGRFSLGRFDGDDCYPLEEKLVKHTHFTINFTDGLQLRFIDPRRFGRLWLFSDLDPANPDPAMESAGMGRLGPEPFDIKPEKFITLLNRQRPIKSFLLDQNRICGLGNIYTDESLFAAGIHPETLCRTVTEEKVRRLLKHIKSILQQAIRFGGTTFSDYRNPYGDMGQFRNRLKVYGREDQPCKRCQSPIQRIQIGGRSSHFCPLCQNKPTA